MSTLARKTRRPSRRPLLGLRRQPGRARARGDAPCPDGSAVPVHGHYRSDLAGPFLAGAGTAFAFSPVPIAGLAGVAEHEAGLASGLLNTAQQLGNGHSGGLAFGAAD